MRDAQRARTYLVEQSVFASTLLDLCVPFDQLRTDTLVVIDSPYWRKLTGVQYDVTVGRIRSHAGWGGLAHYRERRVRYHPTDAARRVVPHELAHVYMDVLSAPDHQDHGHEWRGVYVNLMYAIYGGPYAWELRQGYADAGLAVTDLLTSPPASPIIDIDLDDLHAREKAYHERRPVLVRGPQSLRPSVE